MSEGGQSDYFAYQSKDTDNLMKSQMNMKKEIGLDSQDREQKRRSLVLDYGLL